jgi:Protein of unknown function (DUF3592)
MAELRKNHAAATRQPRTGRQILFCALAILVGLAFLVLGFKERNAINRTRAVGAAAVVEPIKDYTVSKSKGSSTYSASFTFKTESGQAISKRRPFPEELLSDFERGRDVKVLYDPKNPSDFVFEKESASWLPMLVGVAFLVGAFFVFL